MANNPIHKAHLIMQATLIKARCKILNMVCASTQPSELEVNETIPC